MPETEKYQVYVVTYTKINVYKTTATGASNKVGTISKGAEFKATDAGVHNNHPWYKLEEVRNQGRSSGSLKGRYVVDIGKGRFVPAGTADHAMTQFDPSDPSIIVGGGSGEALSPDDEANLTLDKAFLSLYGSYESQNDYNTLLKDGLRIQDIRGVLGIPHQFTALTDARLDGTITSDDAIGRTYAEKFIKQIPLLLIVPGIPRFMPGATDTQRNTMISNLFGAKTGISLADLSGNSSGKYYSLKFAYNEYFQFVNPMLRAAAFYLGIEKKQVNGKALGSFNWLYDSEDGGVASNRSFTKFLGPTAGSIAFYANCGNDVSESFGNDTGQSQLASSLNSISDTGRELNFLIGNFGSAVDSATLTKLAGGSDATQISGVADAIDTIMDGHSNIFSNILNKATTILAGGRLVFPEIWTDSSFGRSYSCSMKLTSPSGDAFSVYMNILVPLYHILALTLPRHAADAGQAYFSPFLVRAYCKSMFNIDMGIISSLSITKGAEGQWTTAGLFTSLDVSFEIKDLYNVLFMSTANNDGTGNIVNNITELDYIANTCGINVNDMELERTVALAGSLQFTAQIDRITTNIFTGIMQDFNQKFEDIFGRF